MTIEELQTIISNHEDRIHQLENDLKLAYDMIDKLSQITHATIELDDTQDSRLDSITKRIDSIEDITNVNLLKGVF